MFDISQLEAASELRRELARSSGDRFHEAGALTMLSGAARYLGDLPRARRFLEEAIELDRERGDEYATSIGLANLAHVARDEGDYRRARELLEERLALCRTHGTELEVEWALMSLGQIAVAECAYDEATVLGREALHIASRAGDVDLLPELLGIAAHIAIDRGRPEDGAVLAGAASALAESLGMLLPSGWEDRWYGTKAARETLAGSEFEKLYASGHSLDVDTAIRTALASID